MKLTKYEHACVVLEEQGKKMVIDPGGYTPGFGELDNIVAVVVTHVHPDHFDPGHLRRILDKNPGAQIFTTDEAARQFQKPNVVVVHDGDEHVVEPFNLHFTGKMHAAVHPDWPQAHNTGVRVNNAFYYGGDSLTPPDQPIELLAVPVANAWMKLGEAMDFLTSVKPKHCILTHNAALSGYGNAVATKWLGEMAEKHGIGLTYLKPGESLTL